MMPLDADQRKVLREAYSEASNLGATPRERKALTEALIVESHIRNLNGGDRDSRGPLQQRTSQGWMHPTNVRLAVRDFLTHARGLREAPGSAGRLAQGVQRSAYPQRYDSVASEATQLLQHYGNGSIQSSPSGLRLSSGQSIPDQLRTQTREISDPQAERRVALAQFLQKTDPHSGLLRLGVVDPNEPTTRTITRSMVTGQPSIRVGHTDTGKLSNPAAHHAGVADFEGTKVAAWIKPALEYARKRGWQGRVNSGWRSLADQTRIYNSGVRPAAKPGTSNHEFTAFPGGAVDASDAEHLAAILQRSPYSKLLVWAGAKDPVHFSHPHNGSY